MIEYQNYLAPKTVAEAAEALAAGGVTVLAGGTDLKLQSEANGATTGDTLMNIRRVDGLRGIRTVGGGREGEAGPRTRNGHLEGMTGGIRVRPKRIEIGALATVTDMLTNGVVADAAPILAETADRFASNQIRNMATIGGNICNASPAGDMIIPLLLLEADVELASWADGKLATRTVALSEFFTGPGQTVMQDNELLTTISFDKPADAFVGGFGKTGPRPALEISMVAVGVAGVRENGHLKDARVAYGAVAPTPIRAPKTEAALEGQPLNADTIAAALDAADGEVSPISDVRASDWYRRHLVRVMTEEVLNDVANG